MKIYAYCRVSTAEQNTDRQTDAMAELNIPQQQIYVDKQSGKNFQRPAWQALVEQLKHGDLVYVHSLDRLGRNYEEIQNVWRFLTKDKGVDLVVINMPLLDTRRDRDLVGTFLADTVLSLLSFVAQNERETIRKRQAEGIAAAKARGIHMGRPAKSPPDNFGKLARQWQQGKLKTSELIEQTGLTESTLYRRLREHKIIRRK